MMRLLLAAAAALTLAGAAPAYACGADCPMHKMASADPKAAGHEHHQAKKADDAASAAGDHEACPHMQAGDGTCGCDHADKEQKKEEQKKS